MQTGILDQPVEFQAVIVCGAEPLADQRTKRRNRLPGQCRQIRQTLPKEFGSFIGRRFSARSFSFGRDGGDKGGRVIIIGGRRGGRLGCDGRHAIRHAFRALFLFRAVTGRSLRRRRTYGFIRISLGKDRIEGRDERVTRHASVTQYSYNCRDVHAARLRASTGRYITRA